MVVLLAPAVLPESRPTERPGVDLPGAILATLGLLAVGLSATGTRSWGDPHVVAALLSGVVLLAVFWVVENRATTPLVPVAVLTRPSVGWGNPVGLLALATETSLVFLLTLYLQKVLGYSPLAAGLSFAVLGIGTVLGGTIGPKVVGRVGGTRSIVVGFAVQATATVPLVLLGPTRTSIVLLHVATFVGGVANLVAIVGFMVPVAAGPSLTAPPDRACRPFLGRGRRWWLLPER